MDFARKQLEKYGWTDGKGLGKQENGISEPLKPKLKRSVTGIGHKLASDFTEHWWTQLYDKAASNVQVEDKNGKTKKIKTKDSGFKITNNTWRIQKKPKQTEGLTESQEEYTEYFVKTAVLTSGGSKMRKVKDSESEDEEKEIRDVFQMTDEDLFDACKGRTAHKGARHGLRALGKLARIERQEQMLLSQPQYNDYSHAKKVKKEKPSINDLQIVEDLNLNSDADSVKIKNKKKKRKRCVSNENSEALPKNSKFNKSSGSDTSIQKEITQKKSKEYKRKVIDSEMNDLEVTSEINSTQKKKKHKIAADGETIMDSTESNSKDLPKNSKRMKNKQPKDVKS